MSPVGTPSHGPRGSIDRSRTPIRLSVRTTRVPATTSWGPRAPRDLIVALSEATSNTLAVPVTRLAGVSHGVDGVGQDPADGDLVRAGQRRDRAHARC